MIFFLVPGYCLAQDESYVFQPMVITVMRAHKNMELVEQYWTDKEEREAYKKKRAYYYSNMHSDEIYSQLQNSKELATASTEPLIYYFRTAHMRWPEDGKTEEIQAMHKEFLENVFHKSGKVLAYFPMRHLYRSDSRELIEVIVTTSMADLDESNSVEINKLIEAHWPDEVKRKEFMKAMKNYSTPWHGELVYTNVPALAK